MQPLVSANDGPPCLVKKWPPWISENVLGEPNNPTVDSVTMVRWSLTSALLYLVCKKIIQ